MTRKERIESIMVKLLVTNFRDEGVPDDISSWLLDRAYRTAASVVDFIDLQDLPALSESDGT